MVLIETLLGGVFVLSGVAAYPLLDEDESAAPYTAEEKAETARVISSCRKTILGRNDAAADAMRGSPIATPPPRRIGSDSNLERLAKRRENSPDDVTRVFADAEEWGRLRKYGLGNSPRRFLTYGVERTDERTAPHIVGDSPETFVGRSLYDADATPSYAAHALR